MLVVHLHASVQAIVFGLLLELEAGGEGVAVVGELAAEKTFEAQLHLQPPILPVARPIEEAEAVLGDIELAYMEISSTLADRPAMTKLELCQICCAANIMNGLLELRDHMIEHLRSVGMLDPHASSSSRADGHLDVQHSNSQKSVQSRWRPCTAQGHHPTVGEDTT